MITEERMRECQAHVNERLSHYLPEVKHSSLVSAMRYSSLHGGKRLRPLLVYYTAEMFGLSKQDVDPIALAIECIHCYSLIHDDLPAMDNDDLRRGKPTCHKAFNEATAILAGDALLTLAFEILTCDALVTPAIIRMIANAAGMNGMVKGQALDLASECQSISLSQLRAIHEAKTGALITASVLAGALASTRTSLEDEKALTDFGQAIGLAFQIQDDVLDAIGETTIMGKEAKQDLFRQKCTFVTLLGLDEAKQQAKLYYEKAIDALARFGEKAVPLRELSAFIIERAM